MKLSEIKSGIIEQFFTESANGVSQDQVDSIFESLGKSLGLDLNFDFTSLMESNESADPSKAFKRFTEGRVAMLTIMEEDGMQKNALFAAVRYGALVKITNLAAESIIEKTGDLAAVKNALRQAKNRNDDVFFNITITDKVLP